MFTSRTIGLCFVLTVGLYGVALGQVDNDPLSFGVTGGLSAGSFWNEHSGDSYSYGPRFDGHFGAWLNLRRAVPVDFQLGVLLVRQGAHQELVSREGLVGYDNADLRLTYLQVPVLAHLPLSLPFVNTKFRLLGGPHLAFLLRARTRVGSRTLRPNHLHPGSSYPNRFDVGLTLGVELPIVEFRSVQWAISTQYSLGLLRTGRISGTTVENGRSYKVERSVLRNHLLTLGIVTWW